MPRDHGHHEPAWSVVSNDRMEAADARITAPEWREPRIVGDRAVEEPDYPEWDEPA